MDYSGSGTNQEIDDQGSILPGYVPYLSLVFKMIATTVISLLSGWVVYTIKTTRSLHKPHNIFVANLLVSGMITSLSDCLISSTMIISFALGVESFIGCFVLKFRLLPFYVNNMSFVIIAADKVVAIRFPFKHKRMMTSRVVAVVISGAWLIAIIPTAYTITFDVDGVTDVPQYGACLFEGNAFVEAVVIFIIPMVVASILTILLNVRLAIKAFQVHRLIERETRLAGVNSQSTNLSVLRKKLCTIKRNRKPIITLFVVIFGSVSIPLLFTPFLILGRFLVGSQVYLEFTEYVMVPNIGFVIRFFQPLVYGLYFKQVREQMMRCLKRLNKVNSVAPQP